MNITIDTANNVGGSSAGATNTTATNANSTTTTAAAANGNTNNIINQTITGNIATNSSLNLNGTIHNLAAHNLDENAQLINDLKQIQLDNSNGLNRPVVLQSQPQQQQHHVQNVNVQQMQMLHQQQQSPVLAQGITGLNGTNTNKENSRFRIIKTDTDRKVSSPLDGNAEIILNNGMINGANGVFNETASFNVINSNMGSSGMNGINTNNMNPINNSYMNGVITNGGHIQNNLDQQQQHQQQIHHQTQQLPQPSQSNGLNIVNNYQRGRWYVSDIELSNEQQHMSQPHQSTNIQAYNMNHQSPIVISNDLNDPVYSNSSSK